MSARPHTGTRPTPSPHTHDTIMPDGYQRCADGRWRYTIGPSDIVPGARDLCLERLWRFPRTERHVLVPVETAAAARELGWCRDWADGSGAIERRGRRLAHDVWLIPLEEWDARARTPLGIDAPELAPGRLLGVAAVARHAGVEATTVRAWAARGTLPVSVLPSPPGPAWSLPIVMRALAARPGQGHSNTRGAPTATRADVATVGDRLGAEMDHLARLVRGRARS